jgi:hypothetical protein
MGRSCEHGNKLSSYIKLIDLIDSQSTTTLLQCPVMLFIVMFRILHVPYIRGGQLIFKRNHRCGE